MPLATHANKPIIVTISRKKGAHIVFDNDKNQRHDKTPVLMTKRKCANNTGLYVIAGEAPGRSDGVFTRAPESESIPVAIAKRRARWT